MQRLIAVCLGVLSLLCSPAAWSDPAPVDVGVYVNKIQDLNFRENKYALDFFIWFRWKPEGELAAYKPLDSFEIINGRRDGMASIVEKPIGDMKYASAPYMNDPKLFEQVDLEITPESKSSGFPAILAKHGKAPGPICPTWMQSVFPEDSESVELKEK